MMFTRLSLPGSVLALLVYLCGCIDLRADDHDSPWSQPIVQGSQGFDVNMILPKKTDDGSPDPNDIDVLFDPPQPENVPNGFSIVRLLPSDRYAEEVDPERTERANPGIDGYFPLGGYINFHVPVEKMKVVLKPGITFTQESQDGAHAVHLHVQFFRPVPEATHVTVTLSYFELGSRVGQDVDTQDTTLATPSGGDTVAFGVLQDRRMILNSQNLAGTLGSLECSLSSGARFLEVHSYNNFRHAIIGFDGATARLFGGVVEQGEQIQAHFTFTQDPARFSMTWAGDPASATVTDLIGLLRSRATPHRAVESLTRALDFLIGTLHEHEHARPPDGNGADAAFERGLVASGLERYDQAVHALVEATRDGADTSAIQTMIANDGSARIHRLLAALQQRFPGDQAVATATVLVAHGDAALHAGAYEQALDLYARAAQMLTPVAQLVHSRVMGMSPSDGATEVRPDTTIQLAMQDAIDTSTVTTASLKVYNQNTGNRFLGNVSFFSQTNGATVIVFTPLTPFPLGASVGVSVSTSPADPMLTAFGPPVQPSQTHFTITATPPVASLTVTSTNPVNGQTNVSVTAPVTITFSQTLDPTTVSAAGFAINPLTGLSPVLLPSGDAIAVYGGYPFGTTISLTVLAGHIRATNGATLQSDFVLTWTTLPSSGGLTTSTTPANGATQVPISSGALVTSSSPLNMTTATSATLTLSDPGPPNVPCALVQVGPSAVYMLPLSLLSANTPYEIKVTTGLQTTSGDHLPANQTSDFWTR